MYDEIAKGALIRSKAKWINEGEQRNTELLYVWKRNIKLTYNIRN